MTGGHQSPLVFALGVAAMFAPTVAALMVQTVMDEGPHIDWKRLPFKYVPVALFLMPLTLQAIILVRMSIAGPLPWQEWLTAQPDGLFHSPDSRGWGVLTVEGLVARIAFNALSGLVIVSMLALFEEIGWRGWLLPRLAERAGSRLGIVLTSIIWAGWHVPFGLSGIHHIDGMSPTDVALNVSVGVFGSGVIIGWLWVRTESIWLVAIAHGAFNNWGQYSFKYMQDFATPDPASVITLATYGLYAVGILLLAFGMPTRRPHATVPRVLASRTGS
jgi:membrane protease YdiL (CAAX protease family)